MHCTLYSPAYPISILLSFFSLNQLTESYILLYVCNNWYRIEISVAWNEK